MASATRITGKTYWAGCLVAAATCGAGCHNPAGVAPSALPRGSMAPPTASATPNPPAPPAGAAGQYFGQWSGRSTIVSTDGLPACRPAHWRPEAVEHIDVTIFQGPSLQLVQAGLHEPESATNCELLGKEVGTRLQLEGGSLNETYFPIGVFRDCHIKMDTSTWPCSSDPPHVWALDTAIGLEFTDDSQSELRGEMVFRYDHGTGDPWFGPWTRATLRKSVVLRRVLP